MVFHSKVKISVCRFGPFKFIRQHRMNLKGLINTHDLFGQLISSTITEDDDKSCFEERSVYENRK